MKGALVAVGAVILLVISPLVLFTVLASTAMFSTQESETASCTTAVAQNDDEGVSDLTGVPGEWADDVADAAEVAGVPATMLAAQINKESGWNESAVNTSSGAQGMAQFMPATWDAYGKGDPMNGADAIAAMGRYMGELKRLAGAGGLSGDDQLRGAAAAYNWGPGSMEGNGWSLEGLPAETSNYLAVIFDDAQTSFSASCEAAVGGSWDGGLGDGEWTTPLPGGTLTGAGAYGPRNIPGYPAWANNHAGIDLATPGGQGVVIAPMPLRVTGLYSTDGCVLAKATEGPAFGLEFCHLDAVYVKVGQKLDRGGRIGEEGGVAGNLGGRTVEHLHFAMYDPSGPDPQYPGHQNPVIDPTPLLREKGAL